MPKSFDIVEEKLFETEFFLERLRSSGYASFEARCFFSAFVSASRSVTFALQNSLKGVRGFDEWYVEHAQNKLKADELSRHFVEIRNDVVKRGINPLNRISLEHLSQHLTHQMRTKDRSHVLVVPAEGSGETRLTDAMQACQDYFTCLVTVVFDCYDKFRLVVDPRWYFTHDNFRSEGKTLGDALAGLGYPRDWLTCAPDGCDVWRMLRQQQPPCALNETFRKYLGHEIPDPDDPIRDSTAV
jgi:hypothetical protein